MAGKKKVAKKTKAKEKCKHEHVCDWLMGGGTNTKRAFAPPTGYAWPAQPAAGDAYLAHLQYSLKRIYLAVKQLEDHVICGSPKPSKPILLGPCGSGNEENAPPPPPKYPPD